MVHIGREMTRLNMNIPLLIGGATTSRMHTAVKIEPEYAGGVVHVLDASRSVTVAGSLLNPDQKATFVEGIKTEYQQLRSDFGDRKSAKNKIGYQEAVSNAGMVTTTQKAPKPTFTGTRNIDMEDLSVLIPYIDWQPFFITWEMHGKFPALLSDPIIGEEATKLYTDAQQMLQTMVSEKWLKGRAVIGFWPVEKTGPDTIQLSSQASPTSLEFLRQQSKKASGQPNLSLADFIVNGETDHLGAFSVTITGVDEKAKEFESQQDDYNKILLQALGDRLAEAMAEYVHEHVRKIDWGYASDEQCDAPDLIAEKYIGIRPAPGYPACPDHTEKIKLFELLGGEENTGIKLTESLAMYPASSICGWYFAHPESKYFGVGKIGEDQLEDYARRKGMPLEEVRKWLQPILD
jgi:5-methyltetrahydrofolate--homocysteine methyltransferase